MNQNSFNKRYISLFFLLILLLPIIPISDNIQASPSQTSALMPETTTGVDIVMTDTYTISGRVTDDQGQPLAGITVQANKTTGDIVVKDEFDPANMISGAEVFRNGVICWHNRCQRTPLHS
jgi:hypothetical protein